MTDILIQRWAEFSAEEPPRHRWILGRDLGIGGKTAALCMVNPSIAGAEVDDPTITKVMGFGARLGIGRWLIVNEHAAVSTDIKGLREIEDTVGPENDAYIEKAFREADLHIVAWGPLAKLPPRCRDRWREVVAIADRVGCQLLCWGTAQDGHPRHPLMLAYATPLVPWVRPA